MNAFAFVVEELIQRSNNDIHVSCMIYGVDDGKKEKKKNSTFYVCLKCRKSNVMWWQMASLLKCATNKMHQQNVCNIDTSNSDYTRRDTVYPVLYCLTCVIRGFNA